MRLCLTSYLRLTGNVQIAGTLGTGLFLGSGQALSGAGPVGALVAYSLVGTVAYSSVSLSLTPSHDNLSGSSKVRYVRWAK